MDDIYQLFEQLGVAYKEHTHPPVYTCEEAEKYYAMMRGGQSKNLFLRNRNGDQHYLVVVESKKMLDLKALAKVLNESKLGMASPERLMKYLKVTPGAVSLLCSIHPEARDVKLFIDRDLWNYEYLNYHP